MCSYKRDKTVTARCRSCWHFPFPNQLVIPLLLILIECNWLHIFFLILFLGFAVLGLHAFASAIGCTLSIDSTGTLVLHNFLHCTRRWVSTLVCGCYWHIGAGVHWHYFYFDSVHWHYNILLDSAHWCNKYTFYWYWWYLLVLQLLILILLVLLVLQILIWFYNYNLLLGILQFTLLLGAALFWLLGLWLAAWGSVVDRATQGFWPCYYSNS